MPNIFEAVLSVMRSLMDNESKPPLHVGEVNYAWVYLTSLREALIYEQIGLTTTTDSELEHALQQGFDMCKSQSEKLEAFLLNEGVPLPPVSEPKPKSESKDIPHGVKLSDEEIANGLAIKIVASTMECATAVANAVRPDYGQMFAGFLGEHMAFGITLKLLMKKHGWLKVPPYFTPPGSPSLE